MGEIDEFEISGVDDPAEPLAEHSDGVVSKGEVKEEHG